MKLGCLLWGPWNWLCQKLGDRQFYKAIRKTGTLEYERRMDRYFYWIDRKRRQP